MKKASVILYCLLSLYSDAAFGQTISTVSTRWADSFVEWDLYATETATDAAADASQTEEFLYGALQLRWLNVKNDWSEWDYQLGDDRGTIRQRWKNDPSLWELRSYSGTTITMRTAWPGDFSQWRITDNQTSLLLKSRWTNQLDEWIAKDRQLGTFYLYTLRPRDPRDWVVDDQLSETVTPPMKLAMIFLTLFHATPKQ